MPLLMTDRQDENTRCEKCNSSMIRASGYDPDLTLILHGGKRIKGEIWVCVNLSCEDGRWNTKER